MIWSKGKSIDPGNDDDYVPESGCQLLIESDKVGRTVRYYEYVLYCTLLVWSCAAAPPPSGRWRTATPVDADTVSWPCRTSVQYLVGAVYCTQHTKPAAVTIMGSILQSPSSTAMRREKQFMHTWTLWDRY